VTRCHGLRPGRAVAGQLLEALRANRGHLGTLLAKYVPAVRWRPEDVQATYLAWLDCSPLGLDDPAGVFEQRGRVASAGPAVRDGCRRLRTAQLRHVTSNSGRGHTTDARGHSFN
jgi:bifunctional pyridoxal-dependent enzyme with beta-cystathionase and maltose regulon repressor activities